MQDRYDWLVLDLDGTLLGPDGHVAEAERQAIDAVRAAGVEVIVATGRAPVESRHVLEAIDHRGTLIAASGSIIADAAADRTVHAESMPAELVRTVTSVLVGHGHKVLLLKEPDTAGYDYLAVGPGELDPASAWWFEQWPVRVRFCHDDADDPHPGHTVRVGIVAQGRELGPLATLLRDEVGDRAMLHHWSAVTESEATGSQTHLLEVFQPKVNKWTAIERLARERGVDPCRVVAIGDGLNDVELIAGAGLGIAMDNADPRVHAVSDRRTAGHHEGGVAQAVERLLDGRW